LLYGGKKKGRNHISETSLELLYFSLKKRGKTLENSFQVIADNFSFFSLYRMEKGVLADTRVEDNTIFSSSTILSLEGEGGGSRSSSSKSIP